MTKRVFRTGAHEVTVLLGGRLIVIALIGDADHALTDEQLIERAQRAETMGR